MDMAGYFSRIRLLLTDRRSNLVNYKGFLLAVLITGVLTSGVQTAYGAQLSTIVNPNNDSSDFQMKYQKTVYIEYEDGGQIADMLRDKTWDVSFMASTPDPDVTSLMESLNKKIAADGSVTQISDLSVDYSAVLTGRMLSTSIDYKVVLEGKLANYNIAEEGGVSGQKLVDLGWRGLSVQGPVIINGIEINMPGSVLAENEQAVYSQIQGSDAEALLNQPLLNAEGIKNQPLGNWHFLFDPTGIGADANTFGLSDDIKGFVVSGFTMGESSIREGRQVETDLYEEFTADKTYGIRTIQSADTANLSIIGFAAIDNLGGLEIAGVTPTAPEDYGTTSTGGFPVAIIYGMAGLAAVGGGAFFVFSNRQLKKEQGQGQTGIDPSRLTGYQTSASSGGYQTNRGEAQLTDTIEYDQTRSVYDGQAERPAEQPSIPAAVESEAACGCAASADSGNECDCNMQSQCFCDATCGCNSDICKEAVKDMQ